MKIGPVGAEIFQADSRRDGQTDMTQLVTVFRNFVNVPKKTPITECCIGQNSLFILR